MLRCKEATRLISRSMDQPLFWRERLALRLHLAMCRLCRRYQTQLFWLERVLEISLAESAIEV
ncbi:MAG: zf-HC2 domain-containing protein [Acidobacteria bacterium]|nr:zf-HC2 domain-containing protein [Acidobacteriota bacterium]